MLNALLPMMKITSSSSVTLHRDDCETSAAIIFVDIRSSREVLLVSERAKSTLHVWSLERVFVVKRKGRKAKREGRKRSGNSVQVVVLLLLALHWCLRCNSSLQP